MADTVDFVARGDTFFLVVAGDTSRLFRITGEDTSYISQSVIRRPAGAAGAIALAVPQAIPERWEADADSTRPEVGGEPSPPVERDTLPVHDLGRGSTFAEYAADEVSEFLARVRTDSAAPTPAAWQRAHPDDRLERSVGDDAQYWRYDDFAGRWCARSMRRVRTADGGVSWRRVHFYPPPMPASARLPSLSGEAGADFEHCRLGSFRLETEVDESAGGSVEGALRRALTERLGEGGAAPRPSEVSPHRWSRYASWRIDETTVATTHEDVYRGVRVSVAAWTPTAGLDLPDHYSPYPDEEVEQDAHFREVARLGGLNGERALHLLSAARDRRWVRDEQAERTRLDSLFLDRLEAWIADGRELRPERRAASLLIADRALATGGLGAAGPDSAAVRRRLLRLGATVEKLWGEGYHYGYAGDLLLEAYRLARGTPVGDQAFLHLLASGFDPSPNCPETHAWPDVIERGEAFLDEARRGWTVDPGILAEAHRLVAEAYADIVAIVAGQVPEAWVISDPEDVVTYSAEDTAHARGRAVAHYQAALDLMSPSTEKESVWRDAWRLTAGLPPLETRFLCTWD